MQIEIKKISKNTKTQSRAEINQDVVSEYAEILKKGKLPAIKLFRDKENYYIADGWHRYEAAKRIGAKMIEAEFETGTLRDAIYYSISSNLDHGLRRTNSDKRKSVSMLLEDKKWAQMSNLQVCEKAGVSLGLVKIIKSELKNSLGYIAKSNLITGKDGRTTNTAKIGKKKSEPREKENKIIKLEKPFRGKSMAPKVGRIFGGRHWKFHKKELDWSGQQGKIHGYKIQQIIEKAIVFNEYIIYGTIENMCDEYGIQMEAGKIKDSFSPATLLAKWGGLRSQIEVKRNRDLANKVKGNMKRSKKQKDLFDDN